jgi:signal transduction histidine kinase
VVPLMSVRTQVTIVVATAIAVVGLAVMAANHGPFPAPADQVVLDLFAGTVAIGAGVLIGRWRPGNRTAWLLVVAGFLILAGLLAWANRPLLFTVGGLVSGTELAVIAHLLLSLPDGRLTERLDRILAGVFYTLAVLSSVIPNLFFECRGAFLTGCPGNLLLVRDDVALQRRSETIFGLLAFTAMVLLVGHLMRRWHRARAAQRRLLAAPYAATLPLAVLGVVDALGLWDRFGQLAGFLRPLLLSLLPVAILIAALRSKARAGDLGGLVVALGPGQAGTPSTNGLPRPGLEAAIAQALADPTARLSDAPRAGGNGSCPEGRARTPILADGEILAVLDHDAALTEEPEVLSAVLATAGLALTNERLAARVQHQLAEVQASRSRLLVAQDQERRRIERDLHDGAQQLLVSAQLLLRMALDRDGDVELVSDAADQLDAAVDELRALARGVHPDLLGQRGLLAAVETLAERAPIPVAVTGTVERLPDLIETTAYFVVAEALTNVAKHADATHAEVSLRAAGSELRVGVTDDGQGGVRFGAGSGLTGLRDRVEAAGGQLEVTSSPRAGCTVVATLPANGEAGP